jgi:glucose/arabinose dehydrogenase
VATLRGQELLTISFNGNGTVVKNMQPWLRNEYGRLREVIEGKDGSIYLTTSNRDGRGNVNVGDDKIIKLIRKY